MSHRANERRDRDAELDKRDADSGQVGSESGGQSGDSKGWLQTLKPPMRRVWRNLPKKIKHTRQESSKESRTREAIRSVRFAATKTGGPPMKTSFA